MWRRFLLSCSVLVVFFAWLMFFARRGLFVQLSADDMMNLYGAWSVPGKDLLLANLTPFSKMYRPFGGAAYVFLFHLFQFNALGFRVVSYLLILLNAVLALQLARKLTGRGDTAFLAGFLCVFHPGLTGIYLNEGTLYDVLCFSFYLAALLYFVSLRQAGKAIRGARFALLAALAVAALNSKEMAATLPGAMLAYDLVYDLPATLTLKAIFQWLWRGKIVIWTLAIVCVIAILRKTSSGTALDIAPYCVSLTLQRLRETAPRLMEQLFCLRVRAFDMLSTLVVLFTPLAAGWLFRKKSIVYAGLLVLLLPLPVFFIPYRAFFVMYLALCGWAIAAAEVLTICYDALCRQLPRPRTGFLTAGLFVYFAATLGSLYVRDNGVIRAYADTEGNGIRTYRKQLEALHLPVAKSTRILLLDDPFTDHEWTPVFIARLLYRYPELWIERAKTMPARPGEEALLSYDYVLDHRDGKLIVTGLGKAAHVPGQPSRNPN